MFNYSIKENILYGNTSAKNSEIIKSAEIANVMEFLESDELDNVIDDNSESLKKLFGSMQVFFMT